MVDYSRRMYVPWTNRRCQLIKRHYSVEYFKGKSVLEVGCGHAGFLTRWRNWGCDPIVACEGRRLCVEDLRDEVDYAEIVCHNLEHPWPFGQFDIIANMGVLYHVANPEQLLKDCMSSCNDLILETEVCDSQDPYKIVHVQERPERQGHSISGDSYRPTPAWVERVLEEGGFEHKIVTGKNAQFISVAGHNYKWEHKNTGRVLGGMRRFWFARKK